MKDIEPEPRHHLQGMVAVKIRLSAPDALKHLRRMPNGPANALAEIRAEMREFRVRLVGGQRVGDYETAAVQRLGQAVRALGQLARVAELHRDEDQVAGEQG